MQESKFCYKVIIGDGVDNCLKLELSQDDFNHINLGSFVELGLIVTVHKIFVDGKVQDP